MAGKRRGRLVMATVACAIAAGVIAYSYQTDRMRTEGTVFGDELQAIQDELVLMQTKFDSDVVLRRDGISSEEEFAGAAASHLAGMDALLDRYDLLRPPPQFSSSVDLFRLSTQSQIERDRQTILWLETGDQSYSIRADELHQESFSYELAALGDYKAAQAGRAP